MTDDGLRSGAADTVINLAEHRHNTKPFLHRLIVALGSVLWERYARPVQVVSLQWADWWACASAAAQAHQSELRQDAMVEALLALKLQGTRFYVAGRLEQSVKHGCAIFLTLQSLLPSIPPILRRLFIEIPEADVGSASN